MPKGGAKAGKPKARKEEEDAEKEDKQQEEADKDVGDDIAFLTQELRMQIQKTVEVEEKNRELQRLVDEMTEKMAKMTPVETQVENSEAKRQYNRFMHALRRLKNDGKISKITLGNITSYADTDERKEKVVDAFRQFCRDTGGEGDRSITYDEAIRELERLV
jgi:ribosome-binding ATPase YchF (GTP1/OBG family)